MHTELRDDRRLWGAVLVDAVVDDNRERPAVIDPLLRSILIVSNLKSPTKRGPMSTNRFAVCLPNGEVREWGPPFSADGLPPDSVYFGRVIAHIDIALPDAGLTFYLTWSVTELPSYGPDVVVFAIGDEWCRWPYYGDRVRAVFKTYGTRPTHRPPHWDLRDPMVASLVLQWARVTVLGLPSRARQLWRLRPWGRRGIVVALPNGCYQALDDFANGVGDWEERPVDLCFAGSVEHGNQHGTGLRRWIKSPKVHARRAMFTALAEIETRRPDLVVRTRSTQSFDESAQADPDEYARRLAESKIVLAPRGTNVETLRFFEAHKFGAIAVTEPLPDHWFHDGEELVTVQKWSQLPDLVDRLLPTDGDRQLGHRLAEQTRQRWISRYREDAIAAHFIEILRKSGLG